MFKKKVYKILLVVFLAVCLITVYFIFKPNNIVTEKYFIIPRGANIEQVSSILNILGIEDANIFLLKILLFFLKKVGREYTIKSGEYKLFGNVSLWDIVHKITVADVVMRSFTVIEGMTNFQVVQKLNAEFALMGKIDESSLTDIEHLCSIEATFSCYLFPDTYHFTYGTKKQLLLEIMIKKGKETINFFWKNNTNKSLNSKNDLLVLASIIEKETQIIEEMPRIAGVFTNRLLKCMKLQADPTVIYALTKGQYVLGRPLTKDDLKIQDIYNTYYVYGLPPKAICNPGINALRAAANPMQTEELYFVSNGSGGHNFASDINNHIKNIRQK